MVPQLWQATLFLHTPVSQRCCSGGQENDFIDIIEGPLDLGIRDVLGRRTRFQEPPCQSRMLVKGPDLTWCTLSGHPC